MADTTTKPRPQMRAALPQPTWLDVLAPTAQRAPSMRALATVKTVAQPPEPCEGATHGWRQAVRTTFLDLGLPETQAGPFLSAIARHSAGLRIYFARRDQDQRVIRDEQIFAQCREGMTRRAIAKLHKISASQVQRIAKEQAAREAAALVPLSAGNGTESQLPSRPSSTRNRPKP